MWYPNKVVSTWIWFCRLFSGGGGNFMWGGGIAPLIFKGWTGTPYVWGVWVYRVYPCFTSFGCYVCLIYPCLFVPPIFFSLYQLFLSLSRLLFIFQSEFFLVVSLSLSPSLLPLLFQRILGNSCLNLYMIGIATKDHQIAEPKPKPCCCPHSLRVRQGGWRGWGAKRAGCFCHCVFLEKCNHIYLAPSLSIFCTSFCQSLWLSPHTKSVLFWQNWPETESWRDFSRLDGDTHLDQGGTKRNRCQKLCKLIVCSATQPGQRTGYKETHAKQTNGKCWDYSP